MKGNQMKTIKQMLIVIGAAVMLAGCASTDSSGTGGIGNANQTGNVSSPAAPPAVPGPAQDPGQPTGQNGSVSPSNPLGLNATGR